MLPQSVFYLPQEKLDTVMTLLRQRLSEIVPGSPLDEKTVMGPLANQVQLEKSAASDSTRTGRRGYYCLRR